MQAEWKNTVYISKPKKKKKKKKKRNTHKCQTKPPSKMVAGITQLKENFPGKYKALGSIPAPPRIHVKMEGENYCGAFRSPTWGSIKM